MSEENKVLEVVRKKNSVLFTCVDGYSETSFVIDEDTVKVKKKQSYLEITSKNSGEFTVYFDREKYSNASKAYDIVLEEWKRLGTQEYNVEVQSS